MENKSLSMTSIDDILEYYKAIGNIKEGGFHKWLGKDPKEPITDEDIQRGLAAGGHAAKMANFAKNARKWHHKKK